MCANCWRDDLAPWRDRVRPLSPALCYSFMSFPFHSEDTYNELRDALIDRLNDKESMIRAHAVIALSKLVGSEDLDEGEEPILQSLLEALETDPAPCVLHLLT